MRQRRLFTMTSGDTESVFSGHPRRRLRPHRITGPQHPTDRVLLCTDGFARLVNDYQLYRDWVEVVADMPPQYKTTIDRWRRRTRP